MCNETLKDQQSHLYKCHVCMVSLSILSFFHKSFHGILKQYTYNFEWYFVINLNGISWKMVPGKQSHVESILLMERTVHLDLFLHGFGLQPSTIFFLKRKPDDIVAQNAATTKKVKINLIFFCFLIQSEFKIKYFIVMKWSQARLNMRILSDLVSLY